MCLFGLNNFVYLSSPVFIKRFQGYIFFLNKKHVFNVFIFGVNVLYIYAENYVKQGYSLLDYM